MADNGVVADKAYSQQDGRSKWGTGRGCLHVQRVIVESDFDSDSVVNVNVSRDF